MEHKLIMENWRKNMAEFVNPVENPMMATRQANFSAQAISIGDSFDDLISGLGRLKKAFPSIKIDKKTSRTLLNIISLFDPTGLSKYPQLAASINDFRKEKPKTFWTSFRLCVAILEVLPVVGKAATASKTFLSLLRVAWTSIKQAIGKAPNAARILGKWLTKGDLAFAATA